jgi:hypothetical protein
MTAPRRTVRARLLGRDGVAALLRADPAEVQDTRAAMTALLQRPPQTLPPPARRDLEPTTQPPSRGFHFGTGSYGGLSQREIGKIAQSSGQPYHVRLFFLAMADANSIGHAEYGPGELRTRLRTVDGNGDVKEPPNSVMSRAIGRAKAERMLAPESNARCLVLPYRLWHRGDVRGIQCREHKINVKPSRPTQGAKVDL